jgi:hypothetical protein
MRLFELINFEPKNTKRDYKTHANRISDTTKSKYQGSGHFAKVSHHDTPKRQNQVRKSGVAGMIGLDHPRRVTDPAEDGYLCYIKMVVESGNKNPYFPRIHNVKTFRAPDGTIYYDVDLEKLYPYETEEISGNEDLISSLRDRMFIDDENTKDDGISSLILNSDYDVSHIKDPKLKEAIIKIQAVAKEGDHSWDLGPSNMMWRITGNMPQLVFTDPIA